MQRLPVPAIPPQTTPKLHLKTQLTCKNTILAKPAEPFRLAAANRRAMATPSPRQAQGEEQEFPLTDIFCRQPSPLLQHRLRSFYGSRREGDVSSDHGRLYSCWCDVRGGDGRSCLLHFHPRVHERRFTGRSAVLQRSGQRCCAGYLRNVILHARGGLVVRLGGPCHGGHGGRGTVRRLPVPVGWPRSLVVDPLV